MVGRWGKRIRVVLGQSLAVQSKTMSELEEVILLCSQSAMLLLLLWQLLGYLSLGL